VAAAGSQADSGTPAHLASALDDVGWRTANDGLFEYAYISKTSFSLNLKFRLVICDWGLRRRNEKNDRRRRAGRGHICEFRSPTKWKLG
jgi:hypothetical protein